jgi:uncharacterized protein
VDTARAVDNLITYSTEAQVFRAVRSRARRHLDELQQKAAIAHQLASHITSLVLEVTDRCTFRCKYCVFGGGYEGKRVHGTTSMPFDIARRAIDFFLARRAHSHAPPALSYYGGEPLLELDLLKQIVSYIGQVCNPSTVTHHLTTNGLALNQRRVRAFLAENGISLTVSLDGPAHLHDRSRRTVTGAPTHRLVENGLTKLMEEYPEYYKTQVMFNAVVYPGDVLEVIRYFTESDLYLNAKGVLRIGGVDKTGLKSGKETANMPGKPSRNLKSGTQPLRGLVEPTRELDPIARLFVENRRTDVHPHDGLESMFLLDLVHIAQRQRQPIQEFISPSGYCVPGARKLFVARDGVLGMCEKVNAMVPIGHLDHGFDMERIYATLHDLTDIWTPPCSSCVAQRFCGMCPLNVFSADRVVDESLVAKTCGANVSRFLNSLRMYVELGETNPAYIPYLESIVLE